MGTLSLDYNAGVNSGLILTATALQDHSPAVLAGDDETGSGGYGDAADYVKLQTSDTLQSSSIHSGICCRGVSCADPGKYSTVCKIAANLIAG